MVHTKGVMLPCAKFLHLLIRDQWLAPTSSQKLFTSKHWLALCSLTCVPERTLKLFARKSRLTLKQQSLILRTVR